MHVIPFNVIVCDLNVRNPGNSIPVVNQFAEHFVVHPSFLLVPNSLNNTDGLMYQYLYCYSHLVVKWKHMDSVEGLPHTMRLYNIYSKGVAHRELIM